MEVEGINLWRQISRQAGSNVISACAGLSQGVLGLQGQTEQRATQQQATPVACLLACGTQTLLALHTCCGTSTGG